MPESVRELVVTLSLEAGTFSKTCSDINAQIKGVETQFTAITGGVDGWKSTIEGRKRKLDALTETLGLQQEKVKAIADVLAAANGQLIAAETPADQLKAARKKSNLETQLYNAQTQANRTKEEIEKLNNIELTNFVSKMTSMGDTLKTFGRKFSLYIGGPLAALGIKTFNFAQDYETALTELSIAAQASEEQTLALNDTLLRMSGEIPVSYTELAGLMKVLSEAGVPIENLEAMTRQIEALKATSDITDDNVTDMVRFMKLMNVPLTDIEAMSSALFTLGINSVATSGEIFAMANRMAATGSLAGFSASEILAMAAAYTSLGIEAEAGGTAANKLAREFQLAAETGKGAHASIEQLSGVMGLTVEQFKSMQTTDPAGLMLNFFDALKRGGAEGNASVLALLDSLGITEARLNVLASTAANNPNFFRDMLSMSEEAWNDTAKAAAAADEAYGTSESATRTSLNKMENSAADIGKNVVDAVQPIIDVVARLTEEFAKLDENTQSNWVAVAGALVLLGPAAMGLGSVYKGISAIATAMAGMGAASVGAAVATFGAIAGAGTALVALGVIVNNYKNPVEFDTKDLKPIQDQLDEIVATSEEITPAIQKVIDKKAEYDKFMSAVTAPEYASGDWKEKGSIVSQFIDGYETEFIAALNNGSLGTLVKTMQSDMEKSLGEAMSAAGMRIPEGLDLGIKTGLLGTGGVLGTANELAIAVDDAVKGPLGIKSPSTVMRQHGMDIDMGLSLGILDGVSLAASAMNVLGAALTAIAAANGTAAGAAYGSAFSRSASLQVSLSLGQIKRELDNLNIRINRGYGSTS